MPRRGSAVWESAAHAQGLLAQRVYGLACGHPDANDADRLADDPMHKLLLGRDPLDGDALASQPPISRFENRVGRDALYAMGRELAATVIDGHRQRRQWRPPGSRSTSTPPRTRPMVRNKHFFSGHDDSWCYLLLLALVTLNHEAVAGVGWDWGVRSGRCVEMPLLMLPILPPAPVQW